MNQQKNHTECTHEPSSSSFDKIARLPRSEDLPSVSMLSCHLQGLSLQIGFLKKSSLWLIAQSLAGKVLTLQQKIEAGIQTSDSPKVPEHAVKACFSVLTINYVLWWLRRGTFMVAGNFGSGGLNPAWATTTEIQTSCGSDFNPKRLPV